MNRSLGIRTLMRSFLKISAYIIFWALFSTKVSSEVEQVKNGLFLPLTEQIIPTELHPLEFVSNHRGVNCIFSSFKFEGDSESEYLKFDGFGNDNIQEKFINFETTRKTPVPDDVLQGLSVTSSTLGLATKCSGQVSESEKDAFWTLVMSPEAWFAFSDDGEVFILLDRLSKFGFIALRD